jgi:hypothetical protein
MLNNIKEENFQYLQELALKDFEEHKETFDKYFM